MFRMYHIPRRGKRKGQELPTNYWHKTVESAEAHSRWWTRMLYEKWFYKEETLPDNVKLKDCDDFLVAYPKN